LGRAREKEKQAARLPDARHRDAKGAIGGRYKGKGEGKERAQRAVPL